MTANDVIMCWRQLLKAGYNKNTKVGCTGFPPLRFFWKRLWSAKFVLQLLVGLSSWEVNQRFSLQHFLLPCLIYVAHSLLSVKSRNGWPFMSQISALRRMLIFLMFIIMFVPALFEPFLCGDNSNVRVWPYPIQIILGVKRTHCIWPEDKKL